MPDIIDFFNRSKRSVDKIVNTTFYKLMESDDLLNQIMPIQNYPIRELLMMKFSHSKPTIASIIAEDQEVPITKSRMILTEELLSDCKLGKAYGFTDRHYELMQRYDSYVALNNIELAKEIKKFFFGVIEDIAPAIVGRMTAMTFDVITTGQCIFTDPITLAKVNLVYPGVIPALFPTTLTGGATWDQAATANGLVNLRDHSRIFYDNFGYYCPNLLIRNSQVRQLTEQVSSKAIYLADKGNGQTATDTTSAYISDEEMIRLIQKMTNCKNVIQFDAMYSEEAANGVAADKYYLKDGYYAFLDNNVIERAMVPTVENDFRPGIYSLAERLSNIPRRDQIAGVGNGLPACFDDRKLAARKVV